MIEVIPIVDIAFKKIFGVEENEDLLISLINSIVEIEDQVCEIQILNPYNAQTYKLQRLSILDIKAKNKEGKRFNIEMQIADQGDYDKRALYYWAKLYSAQLKKSFTYKSLSKAIGIHILNFTSIPKLPDYHNVFRITEKKSGAVYFKDLELHTIELKKFNEKEGLAETLKKVKSSLDKWLTFLTKYDLLESNNLPEELDEPELKKAVRVLEVMNFTEAEIEVYEDHLKWLMTEASALEKAEVKGFEKGIEKGIQQEKIEIAKSMLSKGLDIKLIQELTGLDKQTIENLLKQ
jgi:predicted transposase/invertase (TIGR01784 family)